MAQSDIGGDGGKDRLLVVWLWIGAAAIVTAGFALRVLATILGRADLRFIGIVIIAIGVIVGGIGWLGERLAARRQS